ncbi:MAG: PD40 domain-containing protein [Flavobacteriales bacterium]|nr:PD40 domain-containing protein [Flavobacteriales bacterium]
MKKFGISILPILFLVSCASAQNYSSTNKKAIKHYQEAELAFQSMNNELAIVNLKLAIEKDPRFIEPLIYLGDIYAMMRENKLAEEYYKKAISLQPDFFPAAYYTLGQLAMLRSEYAEAKEYFKKFLSYPSKGQNLQNDAQKQIANCDFAQKAMQNPVNYNPRNLGPEINSSLPEYFPCITADDEMLLFTRRLNDKSTPSGFNEEFYVTYKNNGKWSNAKNIGLPINTQYNEGAPTLSVDGQSLIFTACEFYGEYGPKRKGQGSCDLFYTTMLGNSWIVPVNLGAPINTSNWESQPSYAGDGRTLYFVRGLKTRSGVADQNIYVAVLQDNGKWSEPKLLSNKINTPGREESVFIHPDGKTLYFSSDGHTGMGGLDIFVSRMDEQGEWGNPVNLGYPINTSGDENSLLVSADGKLAYFASDREGGYGELDLYAFDLPLEFAPTPVTYLRGLVYDAETKKPLDARFELIDLSTGKQVAETFSNAGTGFYLVALPSSKEYAINASKDGYLFFSENFTLTTPENFKPYEKDVPMKPIKEGEAVVLKNIFFETAKFNLEEKSKAELEKLFIFLNKNQSVKIEISGHTDNVGNKQSNITLSDNRAKAVYHYLIEKGIEKTRLSYKGYGDEKPVDTNDTETGRANNRRTEFKITAK